MPLLILLLYAAIVAGATVAVVMVVKALRRIAEAQEETSRSLADIYRAIKSRSETGEKLL